MYVIVDVVLIGFRIWLVGRSEEEGDIGVRDDNWVFNLGRWLDGVIISDIENCREGKGVEGMMKD